MKNILVSILLLSLAVVASAQDEMKKKMESRAEEMIRVIGLSDEQAYRKFIRENYSEEFINKPMRMQIQGGEQPANTNEKKGGPIEDKVKMYSRFHEDIGTGKIISKKINGETLEMNVSGSTGTVLTITLTYLKSSPYLIDAARAQLTMER